MEKVKIGREGSYQVPIDSVGAEVEEDLYVDVPWLCEAWKEPVVR